jgi:SAM-dependent methyltransferase
VKIDNLKDAWDCSYENGDNDLKFPSEEIVRSLHKDIYPNINIFPNAKLSVLDFGCGAGRNTQIFDKDKYEVYGYDLSTEAINMASSRFPECNFTTNSNEYMSRKYHIIVADSCLDSMPWYDAVSSVTEIYNSLYNKGFFVLSLLEADSKRTRYNDLDDILIQDEFEKDTIQIYFDWVRVERLLLPMFEILFAYKVAHKDQNGDLLFSRWFISCRAN